MIFNIFLQIVQKDLPLPLPAPEWLLITVLITMFLAHIVFINLMVGGSILVLIYQILGLKKPAYDKLAYEVTKTITVNKSLGIVLGVAPLLAINTLYTTYFYTANALTGLVWILVIPLVSIALLLLYAHKFLWERLASNKFLHISMMVTVVAIFLFIPLVFLTNVNLMLFPDKWSVVQGFVSALTLPNVFPRYFHFLNACMAATGLFLVWYFGKKAYEFEVKIPGLSRFAIRKQLYTITFWGSAVQFIVGPIVIFTLPTQGIAANMLWVIFTGVGVAIFAMAYLWKEINASEATFGKHWRKITIAMTIVILFMGSGRHIYRANALAPHQKLVAQKTAAYEKLVKEAKLELTNAHKKDKKKEGNKATISPGKVVFEESCIACHQIDSQLVGPSMQEAAKIYKNDKQSLIQWIKKPGKKRKGPAMPPQTHLNKQQLEDVAQWILSLNKK